MVLYIPMLEWETLQENYHIKVITEPESLAQSGESIEISRGDDYLIQAKITGQPNVTLDTKHDDHSAGQLVRPFKVVGTDIHRLTTYELHGCAIHQVVSRSSLKPAGDYVSRYTAEMDPTRLRIIPGAARDRAWLTEWYLNAPESQAFCSRSTKREFEAEYKRKRDPVSNDDIKYPGAKVSSNTRDYAHVRLGQKSCILHSVPNQFGPSWSRKIGIEYREDLGGIPNQETRQAHSEIISFILGRHLLNVGTTEYDRLGQPIGAVAVSPWADARVTCGLPQYPPVKLSLWDSIQPPESLFENLIPKYMERRESLGLSEALWRYWLAMHLPVGTSMPLIATGIEIMSNAWFKCNKSRSKGVYLDKEAWDELVTEDLNRIAKALGAHEYRERMMSRLSNCNQMGGNERIEVFFREIGLKIGEAEKNAIKARNKMAHASSGDSRGKIEIIVRQTDTYRTLFHRVLLKLLEHTGTYTDYSTVGWPDHSLDEPASGMVGESSDSAAE